MSVLKFLHTADWHHYDAISDITKPALTFIADQAEQIKPAISIIAGDLIMKRGYITPTENLVIRETALRIVEASERTIIIPGNHDLSNNWEKVNAITGLFARLTKEHPSIHDRLILSSTFRKFYVDFAGGEKIQFITLPHPSKYLYLSQEHEGDAKALNAALTKLMHDMLDQAYVWATDAKNQGIRTIGIGHGLIAGGVADSEAVLTNEIDLAIDRKWLGDGLIQWMYGHLHKRQDVGSAFFCGSPAPLTFAQELQKPSFELWDVPTDPNEILTHNPVYIPIAHQMLTVEITADELAGIADPMNYVLLKLDGIALKDSKVRIRIQIHRETAAMISKSTIERYLEDQNVHSSKVMIEKLDPIRIRADKMDQELGMDNMLEVWSSLDPERGSNLELMNEIDEKVTAEIPAGDLHFLSGVDYKIHRLIARNFKPLIDIDILFDELGQIICIVGDNHLGKSQIAEVERFCLWKKLRKGTLIGNAVRNGTQSAETEIHFSARGSKDLFRVKRTVRITSRGAANSDVIFSKFVPETEEWIPVNEGNSGETQAEIEKHVGSYELYRATRFGSQSEIDLLCSMLPAEMKDTLQESMNFKSFDLRKGIAELQMKALRADYDSVTTKLDSLTAAVAAEEGLKATHDNYTETKRLREIEIQGYQDDQKAAEKKLNDATLIADQIREIDTELSALWVKMNNHNDEISTQQGIIDKSKIADAGIEKLKDLRAKALDTQETLNELNESIQLVKDKRTGILTDKEAVLKRVNALKITIKALNTEHDNLLQEHKRKQFALNEKIDGFKNQAALAKEVPCNGMDIQPKCKLMQSALQAKTELETQEQMLEDLQEPDVSRILTDIQQNEDLLKPLEDQIDGFQTEYVTLGERLQEMEPKHTGLQNQLSLQQSNIRTEEAANWEEIKQQSVAAETALKSAQEALVDVQGRQTTLSEKKTALQADVVEIQPLQNKVTSLGTSITGIQNLLNDNLRQIGALEENLRQLEEQKTELLHLQQVNESGLAYINAYLHYIAAVSRDGIPYLLMEKALPRFEEYANGFLCVDEGFDTTLRLSISAVKDTQTGAARDEVVISFIDDRGSHPLGEASGFQRVAIGYALRASMAKIQADATGAVINHCIFDEGWGAFDQNNLMLARRMVQKLGEEFGQFFYITHVPVLQEIADTVIRVIPLDGGAGIVIE